MVSWEEFTYATGSLGFVVAAAAAVVLIPSFFFFLPLQWKCNFQPLLHGSFGHLCPEQSNMQSN